MSLFKSGRFWAFLIVVSAIIYQGFLKPHPNQALINAIRYDSAEKVIRLIRAQIHSDDPAYTLIAKVDDIDLGGGRTALQVASKYGKVDLVRRLLTELKANPNSRNQADGGTALHQAAAYDSSGACTKVLIEYGADTEAESRAGWTPLFSAVYFSQAASVAVLLKAGANVEHRVRGFDSSASSLGQPLLALAFTHSSLEVGKMVSDMGATLPRGHREYDRAQLLRSTPWEKIPRTKGVDWP